MKTSTTSTVPNRPQSETNDHLSLSQAARLAPGKPTPNCIWRWCRRGVKARTGERIRLEHVRIGGKLFTTRRWINEFGERLAEADRAYFDVADDEVVEKSPAPRSRAKRSGRQNRQGRDADREARHRQVEAELEAEGL